MYLLRETCLSRLEFSAEKSVAIFHEVRCNSYSIASIFMENIGRFGKLKIIGLEQGFLMQTSQPKSMSKKNKKLIFCSYSCVYSSLVLNKILEDKNIDVVAIVIQAGFLSLIMVH